jgi:hypothetical protein
LSKIALTGNASGSGTLTIAAPNTSTDRTLTLPDSAGTIATVNGITEADMWRLTTTFTTTSGIEDLTANFERVDDPTFAKIGTGMSESSGLWAFPSTGLYVVTMSAYFVYAASLSYVGLHFYVSPDNGASFDLLSSNFQSLYSGTGSAYAGTINVESFVNVTDTSNVKVKFSTYTSGVCYLTGNTNNNRAWFKFIRLGDSQ